MGNFIKKYAFYVVMAVIMALLGGGASTAYHNHKVHKLSTETDIVTSNAQDILRSADIAMERIYEQAERTVKANNAEIRKTIKKLSAGDVANELNIMLNDYRKSR